MYRKVTKSIEVSVEPEYLDEHSRPEECVYVWAYKIEIANHSPKTVQLRNRYWHITDGAGQQLEVRGAGVVGDQPHIRPGASYTYSSFTNLGTPSGLMVGSYEMEDETGSKFEIGIPAFSLDSPEQLALPN